jgi:hypothetical protein
VLLKHGTDDRINAYVPKKTILKEQPKLNKLSQYFFFDLVQNFLSTLNRRKEMDTKPTTEFYAPKTINLSENFTSSSQTYKVQ